jgi:hypothetical protein
VIVVPRETPVSNRIRSELMSFSRRLTPTAPFSAAFLAGLADELRSGGPINDLLLNHPAAKAPQFGLRALAGVNQLVLSGQVPELAALIPAAARAGDAWAVTRKVVLTYPDRILAALDRPVQQHLPNRAAELLRGLAVIGASRIRLLEIGACAGLNLIFDRYHWRGPDWRWGDPHSGVRLPAKGPFPGRIEVVDRRGCDLNPLDPADPRDALVLRSFIPAEHTIERGQLDQALRIAGQAGVAVEPLSAAPWLHARLRDGADPTVTTVVWHSLVWHHLDPAEQSAVERLLAEAATGMPVFRVGFEPANSAAKPTLGVTKYSRR